MNQRKRVSKIEDLQERFLTALEHLSDDEFDAHVFRLCEQLQDLGLVLPGDWRDRYNADPLTFLEWVGREANELREISQPED